METWDRVYEMYQKVSYVLYTQSIKFLLRVQEVLSCVQFHLGLVISKWTRLFFTQYNQNGNKKSYNINLYVTSGRKSCVMYSPHFLYGWLVTGQP